MNSSISNYGERRAAALDDGGSDYQQRRKEITDAAGMVFKSKGLDATKVSDIAAEAKVDRATFYYYFASKLDVFEEVVARAVQQNTEQALEIRNGDDPAPVKLRTLIVELMESYARTYPYLYVFIQENLSQHGKNRPEWAERLRQFNREYEQVLIGIISDGIKDHTLASRGDPTIIAYGLLGMLGWTNRWFNPRTSKRTAREIGEMFASVFLDGLNLPVEESRD